MHFLLITQKEGHEKEKRQQFTRPFGTLTITSMPKSHQTPNGHEANSNWKQMCSLRQELNSKILILQVFLITNVCHSKALTSVVIVVI